MVAFSRTCRLCAQPRASAIPVLPLLVLPRVKLISRFISGTRADPADVGVPLRARRPFEISTPVVQTRSGLDAAVNLR